MSVFSGEISFRSNTSKPSRRGTRTRLTLLNSTLPLLRVVSVISSLAALLPISIAASRIGSCGLIGSTLCCDPESGAGRVQGYRFFSMKRLVIQIIINLDLGPYFHFRVVLLVFVQQLVVQPPGLHIIRELDIQNFIQLMPDGLIQDGTGSLYTMIQVAYHPVGRRYINFFLSCVLKDKYPGMFEVFVDDADSLDRDKEFTVLREHAKDTPDD